MSLEQLEVRLALALAQPTYVIFQPANGGPAQSQAPVGFTPDQVRTAYGINNISFGGTTGDGTGQTIAIVDAYNDPNALAELDGFDGAMHLTSSGPTLAQQYGPASSFLTVYNQSGEDITQSIATSGQNGVPNVDPVPPGPNQDNWEVEEALDIEWAHAIAPGAKIALVECNSADELDIGVAAAAKLAGVSVVSMSFDGPESMDETSVDSTFVTPSGHQGVTFVASAGDTGSPGGYPAYSPNVVAIGGTKLVLNPLDNSIQSETGWTLGSDAKVPKDATGGGTSQFEPEPAYQRIVQSTNHRTIPDVAFDADPDSGVAIYDSYNNGTQTPWESNGGTSLSAPCWAGLFALVNQGRVLASGTPLNSAGNPTQAVAALYNLPATDFHDITTGSNGAFSAHAGYDEVTGLGTPKANLVVLDLSGYGHPAPLTVTTLADVTGQAGQLSLRDAVSQANLDAQNGKTDTIDFDPSLAGKSITLIAPLNVTGSVTIDAAALAGGITISGANLTQLFLIADGPASMNVVFDGLTLANGYNHVPDSGGGGIANRGTLTLENSTVTGCTAAFGGGIVNVGTLTVINSTISGNTATGSSTGAGIDNEATLAVTNSTISDNLLLNGGSGAGIWSATNNLVLNNTIVALNMQQVPTQFGGSQQVPDADVHGAVSSGSNNLIGIGDALTGLTNGTNHNQIGSGSHPVDPLLAPVNNYGGPTPTMALLPNSPAIGGGSASVALDAHGQQLTADQRGQPLFGNNSNVIDIGAFQSTSGPLTVTTTADPGGLAGLLSLREALNLANSTDLLNANGGHATTIQFASALGGATVTLSQLLRLDGPTITIDASSAPGGVTISGNHATQVFVVGSGATAVLNGLNIVNGQINIPTPGSFFPPGGAGIFNGGTLILTWSTVSGNQVSGGPGGGIDNEGSLTVLDSTITNNSSDGDGGGIWSNGFLTLTDTTLHGNTAPVGGGLYVQGAAPATVDQSTIAANTATNTQLKGGGGIYNNGAPLRLLNTLVAGNFGNNGDLDGSAVSGSHNLVGGGINPHLAALGNYGGPTQTVALLPDSPALNAGGPVTTLTAAAAAATIQVADGTYFAAASLPTLATGSYFSIQVNNNIYDVVGLTLNPDKSATLQLVPRTTIGSSGLLGRAGSPVYLVSDQRGQLATASASAVVDIGAFEAQSGLVVTTSADPGGQIGKVSLREAVNLADAFAQAGDGATVTFATTLGSSLITLTQGPLKITAFPTAGTAAVIIDGTSFQAANNRQLTINGNSQSQVFVISSITAELIDLFIANGSASSNGAEDGGGIENTGATLTVADCTIADCTAADGGAAIANEFATLTVTGSSISENTAQSFGGGIENRGNLTVTNSTIAGNSASSGGGIDVGNGATATVTNSTIADNSATDGGGVSNNAGTLTLVNTLVAANTANSAPDVENDFGTVTASHCVIGDPSGSDITAANDNILSPASPGLSDNFTANGGPTLTLALLSGSPAQAAGGAVTTLNGVINDKTTAVIAVANAAAIASTPGDFPIWIDSEQMLVTNVNVSANTLTVVRGYNGTTKAAHTTFGAPVYLATDQRGFWRSTTGPDVGAYQLSANNGVQTFVVNTAADTTGAANTTSLRDAVTAAAAATAQGKSVMITFDVTKMTTPMIALSEELVLPSGTGTTTIDGGGLITINGESSRLFTVAAGALGAITGLTIQHGSSDEGAGILNYGVLNVSNATIASNSASVPAAGIGGGIGGGIADETDANLTLSHVNLTNNTASIVGGGIYNNGGTVTIGNGSTLSDNSAGQLGGGISSIGTVTIRDSTLTNNSASASGGAGGGIFNDAGSTLTLVNDTLSGNNAPRGDGGAVFNNDATLTSTNDTFSGNTISGNGGGIFNEGGIVTSVDDTFTGNMVSDGAGFYANGGAVTLAGDAFYGNQSFGDKGGSLYNDGATMTLANTTVANNTAVDFGGIVNNSGTLTLTNDTVVGNRANLSGGIHITGGTVKLVNTIVAKNIAAFPDILGFVDDDSSNNIVGNPLGLFGISGGDNGNQVGFEGNLTDLIDPMLAPLNYYGGPTQTMALLPDSMALGAGGAITSTVAGDLTIPANPGNSATTALLSVANAAAIASTPGTYTIKVQDNQLGSIQLVVADVNTTTQPNTLTAVVPAGFSGATFSPTDSIFLAIDQRGQARPVAAGDVGAYQSQAGNLTGSIAVTTAADPGQLAGQLTLREAVDLAEAEEAAAPGTSVTITLPAGLGTITLTTPIVLTGTLTIDGQGTISGNNRSKLFQINSGANVTLGSAVLVAPGLTLEAAEPTFGAISNAGTLTVLNCTFTGNVADVAGGAIYNTGTLTVSNGTFSNDSAGVGGGAIDNAGGVVMVTGCTFSDNSAGLTGGAIDNEVGTLIVANSTITSNTAPSGGAIWNQGTMALTNCTISGNSAQGGGGIYNLETPRLASTTLANTIVAANSATGSPGSGSDVFGAVRSEGYNLIGNTAGSSGWVSTDLQDVNPLLAPLGNYGGPTQTMALLPGSPAIGAGNVASITNPPFSGPPYTDQRGDPRLTNGTVDIGAFESHGFTITYSSGRFQAATVNTGFGAPLVVSVTSADGEPVQGGVVTFNPPGSGASCTFPAASNTAVINASGLASIDVAANTTAGGPYFVYATTARAFGAADFSLTNTPGTIYHLHIQTEPPPAATAGERFNPQPVVYIEDQYDNLLTSDFTTQVTASLEVGTGPLQGTTTVTAVGGMAVFTNLADDQIEPIRVAFNTTTGLPTVTSGNIVVGQGPPVGLVVHTEPSASTNSGKAFATQPVVYVVDQFGRLETGDNTTQVTAVLRTGSGPLLGTTTVTVSGGIGTFTNLADDKAEIITLMFAGTRLDKALSSAITVNSAAASRFSISAPASVSLKTPFTITVTAYDQFGNVATGFDGMVHFKSSDPRAWLPGNYTFSPSDHGVHTIGNAVIFETDASRQTITVVDTTNAKVTGSATVHLSGGDPDIVLADSGAAASGGPPLVKVSTVRARADAALASPDPATVTVGRAVTAGQVEAAVDRVLGSLKGGLLPKNWSSQ